ncbi:flavin-containing monooxygenase [Rhodococcus sp. NPDC127530]|uniref:flavin-containing monooxygenase n=1 Tax=unclassified Rhodococcus (in: high G+C Gram-positive bacteria) TaxID=192944 RepID=UPI0036439A90
MTNTDVEGETSRLDERKIREAVAVANVPTLLMVLFQMTGEQRWLAEPYLPTPVRGLSDNDTAGLEQSLQDEIRHAAAEAILNWGRSGSLAVPQLSPDQLIEMLRVSVGEHVPHRYADMANHELQVGAGETNEAPPMVPPPGFDAIVIGAGASGLCAAYRLGEMGISYTVLERNDEVGGTWLENRYPGCGVDTPSHLYSFSFARHDWSRWFASRDELHGYFQQIADRFGIRPNIRFGIEVEGATWDDDTRRWTLDLIDQDGHRSTTTAAIVISAVGAFNKPKIPSIPGTDSFTGPMVHTARWPEDLDVAGRRVGVIGNGASAMQLVPAIADAAESVTVFQRSPQWAAPFEKFKVDVPEPIRYLMAEVPLYRSWYRLRLTWIFNDRGHDGLQRDAQWPHQHRSINAMNDGHRRFLTRYLVKELDGQLEMLGDVLPTYPPFGKRMLLDNRWFATLARDDVHLQTTPIAEIQDQCVLTTDGLTHPVDVLLFATGFDVVRFLAPMRITGRSGRTLEAAWDGDDARAYLGVAVPDFPNFFCLYGPNTQFGHGGSLISMMELQMNYIVDLMNQMITKDLDSVECSQDVYDDYNRKVDDAHSRMVWSHPGMDVYYRNSKGRVVVNNPFKVVDFWDMIRRADLGDFRTTERASGDMR